ncbi:MAG: hemolysin family protein [Planctomycetia bacterium]|nr:hemolysin family protein [Planctomycetia bacterium]
MDFVWGTLAVLALVAANGFFVAAEFALVKVRKTRIDQLVAEGRRSAKIVQGQLEHLDNYIAATQLGITLASLALGWVGEPALARLFDPVFASIVGEGSKVLSHALAFGVSFFLITALHIVMGELVPKSIALQRSEMTAMWVARPLAIFNRIFRPIVLLMNGIGNLVVRSFGLSSTDDHASIHSVEELEMLVAQSREAGILKPSEERMLRRVFDFGDKRVSQVMMPRTEVEGIPSNAKFPQLIELAATRRFTRFPVYEESLDNIIGVLNIKDLFEMVYQTQEGRKPAFSLRSLIRPVISVPGVLSIDDLLSEMLAKQCHMAVVIDEYGGTAGIVTFEDILEELVGDVRDEFDTNEEESRHPVEVHADGSASISGLMTVSEFNEQFGTELSEQEGYETIAGYTLTQLRRSAEVGDEVVVGQYKLHVDEMADMRIARLIVRRAEISEPQPAAEPAE